MGFLRPKAVVDLKPEAVEKKEISDGCKYEKPKIFLIDVESSAFDVLAGIGFNVVQGSFGQPYEVPASSAFQPVIGDSHLPNFAEQEIVVVDLNYDISVQAVGRRSRPSGELDLWCKTDRGFIDPRSRAASRVNEAFDRVLSRGGVFVVFAAQKTGLQIKVGLQDRYNSFQEHTEWPVTEWGFLTELNNLHVTSDSGVEMSVSNTKTTIGKLLKTHIQGGEYDCKIESVYRNDESWGVIATNKFGKAVALSRTYDSKGLILVLPQLNDKTGFLKSLFTEVLPEIVPHAFPGIEQGRWTHLPEYELPGVLQLTNLRSQLEIKFQAELAALDQQVLDTRKQDGWMHDLLTQTGDPLVEAVKIGLKNIGFNKAIDMDELRDKQGKSRREDLQIQDVSPTLVVDVKGIARFPSDEDVLKAEKHATLLMREENRTDIFGLSFVNHQRHIPPLERDNEMPFRRELIDVALQSKLGLLTSWDFYKLVKNVLLHKWEFKYVRPILYRHGRIEVVPAHYSYIGRVTKVWTDKFGFDMEFGSISVGSKIAIEFSVLFEEGVVDGLMIEGNVATVANVGDKTGVPWPSSRPRPKIGLRVFYVEK